MTGRQLAARVRAADPGLALLKRATRVTVAALTGFYTCLYGFDSPVTAVYSIFTTVALGVLSTVAGSPAQRSRTYLTAAAVGAVLAVAGTWTATSNWLAAGGMLLVGFLVSLAGVGGPRLVGVANGLQLFYILACFPPYAPDTIGYRLGGIALGATLLTTADRLLWPDPGPRPFTVQLAKAADLVATHAQELAAALQLRALRDPTSTAGENVDGAVDMDMDMDMDIVTASPASCRAADEALDALLLARLPPMQRPLSPGARDRGLRHASESLRHVHSRLRTAMIPARATDARAIAALLEPLVSTLRGCAETLRGKTHPPTVDTVRRALGQFDEARMRWLSHPDPVTAPAQLRAGARMTLAAGASLALVEACRAVVGAPVTAPDLVGAEGRPRDNLSPFAYATRATPKLYWDRLALHLTGRSVLLQNAVRTGVVLAAARLVAAALDLSHGFWVLLATLSLMRTSAADTRTTLRPAFVGTVVGALIGGAVITVAGPDRTVYAALMPVVLIAAFTLGPIRGIAWAQGGFALVVSFLFMQIAPGSWQLAEVRLVDVVVGGLTGAVAGLLAWPRGGGGEVRRSAASFLHADGAALQATALDLLGVGDPDAARTRDFAARRALLLAEASNAQYHSERPDPALNHEDLHAALDLGRFILRGGEFLHLRYTSRPPRPVAGADLVPVAAADAAAATDEYADALLHGRRPRPSTAADPITVETAWLLHERVPRELPGDPGDRPAATAAATRDGFGSRELLRPADVEAWLSAVIRYGSRAARPADRSSRQVPAD